MNYNENLYSVLGLDKNVDQDGIKTAYRKLSKQHHPDVNGGKDEEFKKISSAYEVLSDDKKRQEYDTNSPHGKNYNPQSNFFAHFNMGGGFNPFGGAGFNPFADGFSFENIFRRQEEFIEDLDVRTRVNVSLKDVYNNNPIKITFTRNVACEACGFTGFDPGSEEFECESCDGKGNDGFTRCKYCNGTGKIHTGTCQTCYGNKVVNRNEELMLNGSSTIDKSFAKYLRGFGHHSKYYQNKVGTLILDINYINDDRFMKDGANLICKLDVHYKKAIDGFDYEYDHLDDKKYILKIPPRTKDGDALKMPEKGLFITYADGANRNRGDLIIKVNIIIDYSLET